MRQGFDKKQSQIIKGVAIVLMLYQHCFLIGRFETFDISFAPFSANQITRFAAMCNICVSMFAFVSGYGLYYSYKGWKEAHTGRPCSRWIWQRYVRSFSGYWIIVILAWIVCSILNDRPRTIYLFKSSRFMGLVYALLDYLGLSTLFGSPMLVGTWWYMSAAFVFILITPILWSAVHKYGGVCCYVVLMLIPRMLTGYPGTMSPLSFLPVFGLGMICAETSLFTIIDSITRRRSSYLILASGSILLSVVLCFSSMRMSNEQLWDLKWDLFPIVYIICIYLTVGRLPFVNRLLVFLGNHSANVFMTHTFFRIYFRSFVYSRGHFILVVMTLLGMSLLTSFSINGLKKLIRYDRFTAKLEDFPFPFSRLIAERSRKRE